MRANLAFLYCLQRQVEIHEACRKRLRDVAKELSPTDGNKNMRYDDLNIEERKRRRFFYRLDDLEDIFSASASEIQLMREQFQNLIDNVRILL
jgi:hypothetical protein